MQQQYVLLYLLLLYVLLYLVLYYLLLYLLRRLLRLRWQRRSLCRSRHYPSTRVRNPDARACGRRY